MTCRFTRYTERVPHATGSIDNPLSDAQLDEKFRALAGSVLPRTRVEALLAALWKLERLHDMGKLIKLCRTQH